MIGWITATLVVAVLAALVWLGLEATDSGEQVGRHTAGRNADRWDA